MPSPDAAQGAWGDEAPSVPSAMIRTRPLIRGAIEEVVEHLTEPLRRLIAYHFGWSDPQGRETGGDGGKTVRGTLALLSAEAVGAPSASALSGAAAVELLHNFSLLHDDVMDGDRRRRHRPTAWTVFGLGQAIVAGDALLALAHQLLLEDARPVAGRAGHELNRAIGEMIQGQSEDLSFESRLEVTQEECLGMCERKTAALFSCAGAIGALLSGAEERAVEALRSFGHDVGMAYQAVDDALGVWGDASITGKPRASDLRRRKKTIPVVHVLSRGGSHARELIELLSKETMQEKDLARAISVMDDAGSRAWTIALAERYLTRAVDALHGRDLEPSTVNDLAEVAIFTVNRDF